MPPVGPATGRGRRKSRELTPEAERIRARIAAITGAAPHGAWAFDKLVRGLEAGELSVDEAEAMVGYLASPAADGHWRRRGIPPQFVFAPTHVAEILPLAKGWQAGTLRTEPPRGHPPRLVGGLAPDSEPRARRVSPGDRVDHTCRDCGRRMLGTVTEDGWLPDEHGCAAGELAAEAAL